MDKKRRFQPRRQQKQQQEDSSASKHWVKSPYRSTQQNKLASQAVKPYTKGRGKKKQVLTFDEDDRSTFLSGFQKRKAERKQRAKEELNEKVKEEFRRIKEKRDEKLKKLMSDTKLAKELDQHADYAIEYELPEQSVSIKGLDIGNISSSLGLSMGINRPKVEEEEEKKDTKSDDEEDVEEEKSKDPAQIRENLKQIKKSSSKELRKSKVMKTKQRLNTKKARQKKRFGKSSA